ncbi:MAG: acyl carrier protein [Bryobacteraceae bacterium]|jgi:acyl carrier protein
MLDSRLVEAVASVFGLPDDEVKPESSQENVPDWDSVGHLNLILAIEDAYGVQFSTAQIPELTSVAAIQRALDKLNSSS